MAHSVFICYSSKDKLVADAACAALEARRIACWIAPRDILAGEEYGEAIVDALEECQIVLLVFSKEANDSPQVRREIERAVSKGKIIVPFRIQDVMPSRAMEFALSNTHWLDALTPPLESYLVKLCDTMERLLEKHKKTEEPLWKSEEKVEEVVAKPEVVQEEKAKEDKVSFESLAVKKRWRVSTYGWVLATLLITVTGVSGLYFRTSQRGNGEWQQLAGHVPQGEEESPAKQGDVQPTNQGQDSSHSDLVWTDPSTHLMWTLKDNGKDVDWNQATSYCANLRLGGYSDWRLATIDELQGIYDPKINIPGHWSTGILTNWHVKGNLQLSGGHWSSSPGTASGEAWGFLFDTGERGPGRLTHSYTLRALCVRRSRE